MPKKNTPIDLLKVRDVVVAPWCETEAADGAGI